MEGRAATMIRSEGWSPLVILSKSENPVGRPVKASLVSYSSSIRAMALFTMSLIFTTPPECFRLATARIFCSAWSMVWAMSCSSS